MVITPVLHRSPYEATLEPAHLSLVSIDESIRMCLDEVRDFWYVPKNATRFWFELVRKPEENSVAIGLKRWEYTVMWRERVGYCEREFDESKGLCDLLRGVLPLAEWRPVNVILWYK